MSKAVFISSVSQDLGKKANFHLHDLVSQGQKQHMSSLKDDNS